MLLDMAQSFLIAKGGAVESCAAPARARVWVQMMMDMGSGRGLHVARKAPMKDESQPSPAELNVSNKAE